MATNVICSVCGKPYLAHSSRSTINYKLRQGKPMEADDAYVSRRNSLIPEAERMADSAVMATQYPGMAEEEARALWNLSFHLWMDRLCAEKIHGRGWPR